MEYYDYLFPYEIIARIYFDAGNVLKYDKYAAMANTFVYGSTTGRGPTCKPPKLPPCRWPMPDPGEIVNILKENIVEKPLVLPFVDGDMYSFQITRRGELVVTYVHDDGAPHRTYRYNEMRDLETGIEYNFEISIDDGTPLIYPFILEVSNMK